MTNRSTQRFIIFLPLLAALTVLAFSAGGIRAFAAGPSGSFPAEESSAPEASETETASASEDPSASSDTAESHPDPSSGSQDAETSSVFRFQDGVLSGFTKTRLESLKQSGTRIQLTIPSQINNIPVTEIGPDAFAGCSFLTGVLTLPETVTKIGAGAFSGTGFSTVYLPKSLSFCGASAFDSDSVLVFPDQALFDRFSSEKITPDWKKAGYPLRITLQNADGSRTQWDVLYQLPLNYSRDSSGVWQKDPARKLPEIPAGEGYSSCRWVFDPSDPDAAGVTVDSPVTGSRLYAVRTVAQPEIRFSPDIDAACDGKQHTLSVTAKHPLSVSGDFAGEDSVRFHYTWSWEENGQHKEKTGYDLSSLSFTKACSLSVSVTVEARMQKADGTISVLAEKSHTWSVQLTEPESPETETSSEAAKPSETDASSETERPSETDASSEATKPSETGTSPEATKPSETEASSEAAKPSETETSSEATKPSETETSSEAERPSETDASSETPEDASGMPELPDQITGGNVEMTESGSEDGEREISLRFSPDPGFLLDQVLLNGKDITSRVKNNSCILKSEDLSASDRLSVSFRRMTQKELQALFENLPSLDKEGECSEGTEKAYLNAWIHYQALSENGKNLLSGKTLQTYYKNLVYLPCIRLNVDTDETLTDFVSVADSYALLSLFTQEDAQRLLDGTDRLVSFSLKIAPEKLQKNEKEALLALLENSGLAGCCRIEITKTVSGNDPQKTRASADVPLTLQFSLDKGGKPAEGYVRTFRIGVLKDRSSGKPQTELLKTAKETETALTVKASSYPAVFALLYEDKQAETETPSETETESISGTEPSSETESIPASETGSSSVPETESSSAPESGSSSDSQPAGSSGGGSSDDHHEDDDETYVPDYEKEFWEEVRALIQKAKAGETVNVNAVTYDRMPENVMDALRKNPHAALIVRWDGGDPVIIPALTALAREEGRVYYPLSYLSKLYQTINAALTQPLPSTDTKPQITAPVQPSPDYTPTPESMGIKTEGSSPQSGQSGSRSEGGAKNTGAEDGESGPSETETAAEPEGSVPPASSEAQSGHTEPLDTVQVTQAQKSPTTRIVLIASAALLILVLILIAVLLTMRNR